MVFELERRPLLFLLAGLLIGLTAAYLPFNLAFLVPLLLFKRPRLALAAGFAMGSLLAPSIPAKGLVASVPATGVYEVVSGPSISARGQSCIIEAHGTRLRLQAPQTPDLALGDRIRIVGEAVPVLERSEDYELTHGVIGVVKVKEIAIIERSNWLSHEGAAWRRSFLRFSDARLGPETASMADALAFDVRSNLSLEAKRELEQSGTMHIVAASGLHVFGLIWLLELTLRFVPIPRSWRIALILGVLVLYCSAAGFHPATVRAVLMGSFALLASGLRRERDILSALAAAAILYLLWRPQDVFDAGFQLSVVIVAAVGLVVRTSVRPSTWGRVRQILGGSLLVWLVSAPLSACLFGTFSFAALPANLVIVPFLSLEVALLLAAHSLSFVWLPMSDSLLLVASPMADAISSVVRYFGSVGWWGFYVSPFSGYWLAPFYALIVALWKIRARPID